MPACPLCDQFILGSDALVVHLHIEHDEFQHATYDRDSDRIIRGRCPCTFLTKASLDVFRPSPDQQLRFPVMIAELAAHFRQHGGVERHVKQAMLLTAMDSPQPRQSDEFNDYGLEWRQTKWDRDAVNAMRYVIGAVGKSKRGR